MGQFVLLLMYSVNQLDLIWLLPLSHLLAAESCLLPLLLSNHPHVFIIFIPPASFSPSSFSDLSFFRRLCFLPPSRFIAVFSFLSPPAGVCLIREGGFVKVTHWLPITVSFLVSSPSLPYCIHFSPWLLPPLPRPSFPSFALPVRPVSVSPPLHHLITILSSLSLPLWRTDIGVVWASLMNAHISRFLLYKWWRAARGNITTAELSCQNSTCVMYITTNTIFLIYLKLYVRSLMCTFSPFCRLLQLYVSKG